MVGVLRGWFALCVAAAFLALLGLFLPRLQISQICLAVGAADGADVELDVILDFRVEHLQNKVAKLLARWTAEPAAPPDRAGRVFAAIAFLHQAA